MVVDRSWGVSGAVSLKTLPGGICQLQGFKMPLDGVWTLFCLLELAAEDWPLAMSSSCRASKPVCHRRQQPGPSFLHALGSTTAGLLRLLPLAVCKASCVRCAAHLGVGNGGSSDDLVDAVHLPRLDAVEGGP